LQRAAGAHRRRRCEVATSMPTRPKSSSSGNDKANNSGRAAPASAARNGAGGPKSTRKIAVFPGQFDPITNGHLDVIRRGVALFDELIVAVGINPEKREMFSLDERETMIREQVADQPGVRVEQYTGLTMDFVRRSGATAILRGIRDVSDLRTEFQLALANRAVGGVETVFIMTGDQYALTSSSLIRQIVALGGDVEALAGLLPEPVVRRLRERQRGQRRDVPPPDAPAT
jgi:pantetheine-phosphate adenylyltransferase